MVRLKQRFIVAQLDFGDGARGNAARIPEKLPVTLLTSLRAMLTSLFGEVGTLVQLREVAVWVKRSLQGRDQDKAICDWLEALHQNVQAVKSQAEAATREAHGSFEETALPEAIAKAWQALCKAPANSPPAAAARQPGRTEPPMATAPAPSTMPVDPVAPAMSVTSTSTGKRRERPGDAGDVPLAISGTGGKRARQAAAKAKKSKAKQKKQRRKEAAPEEMPSIGFFE